MSSDDVSLRRCVGDVEEFRSNHWGRRPLYRRTGGSFTDLLDVDGIEQLLGLLGRRPGFRVVRDGNTLPVDTYTLTVRVGGTEVHDVADLDEVVELLAGGATVVLQGLQRTWMPLAEFCAELQASISHPVQANAYLSPRQAAAFRRHVDTHAVFALQIAGSKAWTVEGLGELTMEPGDVLYLPAGVAHEARSRDDYSLHVTVGVLTVRWRDVLRRLQTASAGAPEQLEAPLPLGYAHPEAAVEVADGLQIAIDALTEHLAKTDADAVARDEAGRVQARRRGLPGVRLRAAVDPSSIGDGVRLRRTTPATLSTDGEDDRVRLAFSGRSLLLPTFTIEALTAVVEQDEITLDELAGLDEESRHVLARRLVREGLLRPVVSR